MALVEMIPLRPLMLSVLRKFSQKQLEISFHRFLCWSVRFLISGGARTGRTEEGVAKVAKEVEEGHIVTAEAMTDALSGVIPEDVEFQSDFANAKVSHNARGRYYLRALELSKTKQPNPVAIRTEDFVINLEHVLPESPGDDWGWVDKPTIAAYKRRIGNLVLLRADRNNQIANKPFDQKKEAFRSSSFVLTQMVANAATWFPSDIEARQKELAAIAVSTWPIRG
jgi:hypothetical protein